MTWMEFKAQQVRALTDNSPTFDERDVILGAFRDDIPVKREEIVDHFSRVTGVDRGEVNVHLDNIIVKLVRSRKIARASQHGYYVKCQ